MVHKEHATVCDPLMESHNHDPDPQYEPSIDPLPADVATTRPHVQYSAVTPGAREKIEPTHDASPFSPRKLSQLTAWWRDGWIAELLSCGLALIAFIGLIIILRAFNHYVITEIPLKISIDTLVAVLSAVVKSSLLLPVSAGMCITARLN